MPPPPRAATPEPAEPPELLTLPPEVPDESDEEPPASSDEGPSPAAVPHPIAAERSAVHASCPASVMFELISGLKVPPRDRSVACVRVELVAGLAVNDAERLVGRIQLGDRKGIQEVGECLVIGAHEKLLIAGLGEHADEDEAAVAEKRAAPSFTETVVELAVADAVCPGFT